jgi:hypothetical protein
MHRLLALVAFALVQGCVVQIPAFGERWAPGSTVDLVVDGDDDLVAATVRASTAWSVAGSPVHFRVIQGAAADEPLVDGASTVSYSHHPLDDGEALGTAFAWSNELDPELIGELDIVVDPDFTFFTDDTRVTSGETYDLNAVLLHEVGHGLGLKHLEDKTATMWKDLDPGTTDKRTLEEADVTALHEHYAH